MLIGAMGVMSMASSGVRFIRGGLRRTPAVQSVEPLRCNSSCPVSTLIAKSTAAVENELVMEGGEPVPRLVFGTVPSLEETKEATTDLKEALDAMYLSSPNFYESETSLTPGVSLPLKTEIVENRSGVIMENNRSNPGPELVHQAFHIFRHSSIIQNTIVNVVSDPNVYKAVLRNPEVQKLCNSYLTNSDALEDEENVTQEGESEKGVMTKLRNVKELVIEMVTNLPIHFPGLFGYSGIENVSKADHKENTTKEAGKSGSSFMEKLRNLKNSMVEKATNVPKYFPNFHGFSASVGSVPVSDHEEGNTKSFPTESSLGTSVTGLAIMVIMIVLFKRV